MAWKINYVNKEINHNQMTSHGFIDIRARIVSFASWLKVHDTEYSMRSAIFSALSFRRRRIWYWHTSAHTTTLHPTKTTYNRHISMSKYFSNEKPSHSRSMFTNFGRRWQFFLFFGMKFSMTFFCCDLAMCARSQRIDLWRQLKSFTARPACNIVGGDVDCHMASPDVTSSYLRREFQQFHYERKYLLFNFISSQSFFANLFELASRYQSDETKERENFPSSK